jgi:hypothetical protein
MWDDAAWHAADVQSSEPTWKDQILAGLNWFVACGLVYALTVVAFQLRLTAKLDLRAYWAYVKWVGPSRRILADLTLTSLRHPSSSIFVLGLATVGLGITTVFVLRHRPWSAALLIVAVGGSSFVSLIARRVLPLPQAGFHTAAGAGNFPSFTVGMGLAFYLAAGCLAGRLASDRIRRVMFCVAGMGCAATVASMLAVQRPSEILSGAAVSLAWLALLQPAASWLLGREDVVATNPAHAATVPAAGGAVILLRKGWAREFLAGFTVVRRPRVPVLSIPRPPALRLPRVDLARHVRACFAYVWTIVQYPGTVIRTDGGSIRMPHLPLPELHAPRVRLPRVRAPKIRGPKIHAPKLHLPNSKGAQRAGDTASFVKPLSTSKPRRSLTVAAFVGALHPEPLRMPWHGRAKAAGLPLPATAPVAKRAKQPKTLKVPKAAKPPKEAAAPKPRRERSNPRIPKIHAGSIHPFHKKAKPAKSVAAIASNVASAATTAATSTSTAAVVPVVVKTAVVPSAVEATAGIPSVAASVATAMPATGAELNVSAGLAATVLSTPAAALDAASRVGSVDPLNAVPAPKRGFSLRKKPVPATPEELDRMQARLDSWSQRHRIGRGSSKQ